ncbi:MAG: carbohydrate kinase family protein, partial [Desulfonatronovibrio sp.]
DYIQTPESGLIKTERRKLLYHGTLAARNKVSWSTLHKLARDKKARVFCDINLRDPWWTEELVRDILGWCEYLKVNEEELGRVCSLEGINTSADLEQKAEILRKKRDLKCLVVTLGSKGAMLFPEDQEYLFAPSPRVQAFKDSVGAGDAFCSVFLLGIARNWPWKLTLNRAVFFAARICENQGAIPDDNKFYDRVIENWEQENA